MNISKAAQAARRERVLAAILANPRASYRELADAAGLCASTIRRDLHVLADEGAIALGEGNRTIVPHYDPRWLAHYAEQWDAMARAAGNPEA